MTIPTWITPSGFLFTATELVYTSTNVVASGTNLSYQLLSGSLPPGLNLSTTGTIYGTPVAVLTTATSKFVVRAKTTSSIADRTFSINVIGPDNPVWVTPSGYLPLGVFGESYAINNQFVDFQLSATFPETPSSSPVQYYIESKDGKLPPGLTLDFNGKISGFIRDNLIFDGNISPDGGYDTEFYDGYTYDHGTSYIGYQGVDIPAGTPKIYQFRVTASNGVSSVKRDFQIVVTTVNILRFGFNKENTVTVNATAQTGTTTITVSTASNIVLGTYIKPNDNFIKIIGITTAQNKITLGQPLSTSIPISSPLDLYTSNMPKLNGSWSYLPNVPSSIQPLQWLGSSDLGEYRANNFQSIKVEAYDPNPLDGSLTYSLITGTSVLQRLPLELELESNSGRIYGYIPYQPAYKQEYGITIQAVKTNSLTGEQFTSTNTFSLIVKGEVESSIAWVSDTNLGTLYEGLVSELKIEAEQIKSNYPIKYSLISGSLPSGITLARDGSLAGRVSYNTTGTYTFSVKASDIYELSAIEKSFSVNVTKFNNKVYTDIFVKPFLPLDKRTLFRDFVSNEFTFDPKLMYRFFDPNFGIQTEIKMYLQFGIERVNLREYAYALQENFYRKRLYFGDVKLAIAKDSQGNVLYEVIYVDIVDDLINAPRVFYDDNKIYYPGSIENMRYKLSKLVLPNYTYVDIDEYNRPLFMRTAQEGDYKPVGFIPVVPICYALPGQGAKILSRIAISQFNFNVFDFEVDRIIVQNPLDQSSAKYLIMERQTIGDSIPSDNYIFGFDEIRIDSGTDKPLSRE